MTRWQFNILKYLPLLVLQLFHLAEEVLLAAGVATLALQAAFEVEAGPIHQLEVLLFQFHGNCRLLPQCLNFYIIIIVGQWRFALPFLSENYFGLLRLCLFNASYVDHWPLEKLNGATLKLRLALLDLHQVCFI